MIFPEMNPESIHSPLQIKRAASCVSPGPFREVPHVRVPVEAPVHFVKFNMENHVKQPCFACVQTSDA